MINSKEDLKRYLEADRVALHIEKKRPSLLSNEVWKFEIWLRRYEYYFNTQGKGLHKLMKMYSHYMFHYWSVKLNFSIPVNVFNEGLSIAHYGTIVVNGNSKVGKNCRIQEGTCIGATGGSRMAPIIGDNVFIGSGAKIIGEIKIASGTVIGAGAVVIKNIVDENTTWVGVPAHRV